MLAITGTISVFQLENQRFVRAGFGILLLIGTLAGVVAQADQAQSGVVVSERDSAGVPNPIRYQAEGLGTQMFARVGAAMEWLSADVGTPTSILVELATNAGGERKCDQQF
jgi:hypothetical protein